MSEFAGETAALTPTVITTPSSIPADLQQQGEKLEAARTEQLKPAMLARQMDGMAKRIGTIKEDIESGDLYLDPAAGEEIKNMLQEQMDRVDGWIERANSLARRAPFGANPVGEAMALKFEDRAGGEGTSFRGVFTPYREILGEAHEAVTQAMNLYQQIEQDNVDSFKRIRPGGDNEAV
ncbi:hypothetical protein [Actinoalloteichus hymeniacidonis]|uniref:Uncharacterized protein n=1 Tax=Actinoalloteichus hymeniacidonis TaxID=340345 RepID=A0AAC9HTY7_9PSEU|nr:hypothetical protein [Actinoalloteichus hymeniacidonis]AOS64445.1 hypothetical protein TL08_18250 [Actinoalloteichus hymeniacidonis]MBB5907485.1 hypothetical protein [Actinoalloteichus hymeniacidonis]